jgi:hypothetical protein
VTRIWGARWSVILGEAWFDFGLGMNVRMGIAVTVAEIFRFVGG